MPRYAVLIIFLSMLAGCHRFQPSISDQARYDLARPVDCSRAEEDITVLKQEKAEIDEQIKAGVKMFVPAAAARSILHRDYQDRAAVATGQYNQAIEDKIKEICDKCGPIAGGN